MIRNDEITFGVLGGMGPYATIAFCKKILDLTQAKKDWEHFRLIIDNNPHIPSRTRAVLYNEESPVEGMVESCNKLMDYPVDYILLPCNSATYFLPQVQARIGIPILSIVETTVNSMARRYDQGAKVVVWGGYITANHRLYEEPLTAKKFEYLPMSKEDNEKVAAIIEDIKLNDTQCDLQTIREHLQACIHEYNCDLIILGCSEFGCIIDRLSDFPVVDSDTEYAKAVVELGRKSKA